MNGKVFVTGATVKCGHGGEVPDGKLSSERKLTVLKSPVLTRSELDNAIFQAGCSQTNANASEKVCTKVVSVGGTLASKLTVDGVPVIVESLTGTTDGAPKNTDLTGSAGQSKLTAS